jgi:predicted secreted hydrolase
MYFQIRRQDGSIEPASGGTLVERDGRTRQLSRDDVRIEVEDRWRSPESGISYPSRWRVLVPSEGLDLLVEPWLGDQEMRMSFTYWEGAIRVGRVGGRQAAVGQGYVELTGYGRSMRGLF